MKGRGNRLGVAKVTNGRQLVAERKSVYKEKTFYLFINLYGLRLWICLLPH